MPHVYVVNIAPENVNCMTGTILCSSFGKRTQFCVNGKATWDFSVILKYTRKKNLFNFWNLKIFPKNIKKVNYFYMNICSFSSYWEWHSQKLPEFSLYTDLISKHLFTHNEIEVWPLIFTVYFYHSASFLIPEKLLQY